MHASFNLLANHQHNSKSVSISSLSRNNRNQRSKIDSTMSRVRSTESDYHSPVRVYALYSKQSQGIRVRPSSIERTTFRAKSLSPSRNSIPSSREIFRLKIIHNDGGITIDAASNKTMTHVMGIVYSKWLNVLRNGDGLIDDHHWSVQGPPLTEFVYIHRDKCGDRRTKEWREAHELCEKSKHTIPVYEKLESIQGFNKGRQLTVVYGSSRPTNFAIQLVKKYNS